MAALTTSSPSTTSQSSPTPSLLIPREMWPRCTRCGQPAAHHHQEGGHPRGLADSWPMVFDVELARQEWGWQHDTSKIVRSRSIGVETPRKFPGELRSPRPKARKTHGSCDRSLSKIRDELADEFELLRPFYPVRCKFKVCAVRYPSLEEVWCNNITVVGRLGLTHCDVYYCLFSRPSAEEVALPQLFSRISNLQLGWAIPGQFTHLFCCFSSLESVFHLNQDSAEANTGVSNYIPG